MSANMNSDTRLPVVVLAGAQADPEIEARYSVKNPAEVPIAGKMMAQHVIDALKTSKYVGTIRIVGNIHCEGVSEVIQPASSLIENLAAGLNACDPEVDGRRVLIAASDIPLLTPEAVDDFIERCGDLQAGFYYAIVSKEENEKSFPGMRRTYAKLSEGSFTGGNLFIMDSDFLTTNGDLIREILGARKSVPRLARLVGIGTLIRLIIAQVVWPGALNLARLEKTAGRILRMRVKAVVTPFPEIGADIDDIEQIQFAEEALANVQRPTSNVQP